MTFILRQKQQAKTQIIPYKKTAQKQLILFKK